MALELPPSARSSAGPPTGTGRARRRRPGVDQVGDTLNGGSGDDTLRARDGEVDRILLRPGNDSAFLDPVDVIVEATAANPNG